MDKFLESYVNIVLSTQKDIFIPLKRETITIHDFQPTLVKLGGGVESEIRGGGVGAWAPHSSTYGL